MVFITFSSSKFVFFVVLSYLSNIFIISYLYIKCKINFTKYEYISLKTGKLWYNRIKRGFMEMDINTATTLIGNMGFPIAVSIYCLYVLNKTMQTLNSSVADNTRVITLLCEKMDVTVHKTGGNNG